MARSMRKGAVGSCEKGWMVSKLRSQIGQASPSGDMIGKKFFRNWSKSDRACVFPSLYWLVIFLIKPCSGSSFKIDNAKIVAEALK